MWCKKPPVLQIGVSYHACSTCAGSEYDSDENLDLAEEEDILEMEEGDKDQVGTEEELRDQVGRAHL